MKLAASWRAVCQGVLHFWAMLLASVRELELEGHRPAVDLMTNGSCRFCPHLGVWVSRCDAGSVEFRMRRGPSALDAYRFAASELKPRRHGGQGTVIVGAGFVCLAGVRGSEWPIWRWDETDASQSPATIRTGRTMCDRQRLGRHDQHVDGIQSHRH